MERQLSMPQRGQSAMTVKPYTADRRAEKESAMLANPEINPKIPRATVYRTLGLMVEGGFLATLERGHGQTLYEHILGHRHHDHMVCLQCGAIIEFVNDEIERLQESVAAKHQFTITQHTLRLEGRCARCTAAHDGAAAAAD